MWKQFLSLARGQPYEATGAVLNLQAHVILRQQLRDVAATLERARLALAVVVAQEREEERRLGAATLRLADLEERATAALDGGHTALAREAAEMIARLEADQQTSCDTKTALGSEIQRLRLFVTDAESRLVALQRGQRLAEAAGRVGRLRQIEPSGVEASLRDAEATLKLLRERQGEAEAIDRALDEMASEADPGTLSRRLAEAGCGSPVPHSAEAVLKRLDARRRPAGI